MNKNNYLVGAKFIGIQKDFIKNEWTATFRYTHQHKNSSELTFNVNLADVKIRLNNLVANNCDTDQELLAKKALIAETLK